MNEHVSAYRIIGILLAAAGGVGIVLAEVTDAMALLVGGLILVVMGALFLAGSGKGRLARAVRGIIEMLTYIP